MVLHKCKPDIYIELSPALHLQCAPPAPTVWALDLSMIHSVRGLGFRVFWAPNGIRLSAPCYFTGQKNSRIPGPNPLQLPLVMDMMHAFKTFCKGLYKS
jgi:hypothetical protein